MNWILQEPDGSISVYEKMPDPKDRYGSVEEGDSRTDVYFIESTGWVRFDYHLEKPECRGHAREISDREAVAWLVANNFPIPERLQELARQLPSVLIPTLKGNPVHATPAGTIIALGNRQYRIGNHQPVTLNDNEDAVLRAFLNQPTMDRATLVKDAAFEDAPRVLSALRKKCKGIFASAIRLPGKKSQGGYFVSIQKNPAEIAHERRTNPT